MGRTRLPGKQVVVKPGVIVREMLPLPYVHYPGIYGVFLAFSARRADEPTLCGCCRAAVGNYLRMRSLRAPQGRYSDPRRNVMADSFAFPLAIAKMVLHEELDSATPITRRLRFQPGLCHKCSAAVPSMRYRHAIPPAV